MFINFEKIRRNFEITFTHHALDRMKESNVSISEVRSMARSGIIEKYNDSSKKWKESKYGEDQQKTVFYVRYGSYIMTFKFTPDRKTGKDIMLLVTFTNQLHTFKRHGHRS